MRTPASLVDRHVGFVHALRKAGLPVSPAEGLDAAHALMVVDLTERETLREAYAATLVKRPAHRPGFDLLFDLWFPPVITGTEGAAVAELPELPELRGGRSTGRGASAAAGVRAGGSPTLSPRPAATA